MDNVFMSTIMITHNESQMYKPYNMHVTKYPKRKCCYIR